MKNSTPLTFPGKLAAISLIVAAAGVVLQILSGAKYPPVPPVFFILLIPAALIFFFRKPWPLIIVAIAGSFLTLGLFTSGASIRLYQPDTVGDTMGLYIQTIGVLVAVITAIYGIFKR